MILSLKVSIMLVLFHYALSRCVASFSPFVIEYHSSSDYCFFYKIQLSTSFSLLASFSTAE